MLFLSIYISDNSLLLLYILKQIYMEALRDTWIVRPQEKEKEKVKEL